MEHAAEIANVDHAVAHGRRRLADALLDGVLPQHLAISEAQREQVSRSDAHEHAAVGNRRRRFDGVAGLVRPGDFQRLRESGRGHTGEGGSATELRPHIRHGRLRAGRRHAGHESTAGEESSYHAIP